MASNLKTVVPPDSRSVAIDRQIDDSQSVADAVGMLLADAKVALGGMVPDDVSVELSSHTDRERASTNFKYRAYRRRPDGA